MGAPSPTAAAVFRQTLLLSSLAVRADIDAFREHPHALMLLRLLAGGFQQPLLKTADPDDLRHIALPLGSWDEPTRARALRSVDGVSLP